MEHHLHLSHPLLYLQQYPVFLLCNYQHLLLNFNPTCTASCSTSSARPYATSKLVPFKPEFTGKPDEEVEANLLSTNDWMDTHVFPEGVKDQRFCLTLVG